MTEYTINQLIDVDQVRQLLEYHHLISGMSCTLLDNNENILISIGWQEICTRFHRVHPVCFGRCRESDAHIKAHLSEHANDYLEYRCGNGMIDVAMPIIIEGRHLATFFTGQFFYADNPPDRTFFVSQAREFGFNPDDYLTALERVSVFSREHIHTNLMYLRSMVRMLAESGLKSLMLAEEIKQRRLFEERYAVAGFALDQVHEAAYLVDNDGRIQYVNQEACHSLGYSRDELLGMSVPDIDPDYSIETVLQSIERIYEVGSMAFETRHRTSDGRIFPVEITTSLFEYNGIDYNLSLVRDVSERRKMEEQLLERERLLSTLMDNFPDFVARFDTEGRHIFVNQAVVRAFGMPLEEFIGKDLLSLAFVVGENNRRLHEAILQAAVEGESNSLETMWKTPHGCRHFEVRHIPEKDTHGKVVSVLGIARDITEKKRIETELRESEARYRHSSNLLASMLESSPTVGVYALDREYRYLAFNRRHWQGMNNLWGGDIAVGMSLLDAVGSDEYREKIRKVFDEVLTGRNISAEAHFMTVKDGRQVSDYIENYGAPIFDDSGNVVGLTFFTVNITERKQAEEAIRMLNEQLEQRVKDRTAELEAKNAELKQEMNIRFSQQQFLEALLENTEAGIVACNADGILTLFNRKSRELHGLPQTPIPAEQWAQCYALFMPDGKTAMRKEDVPLFRALQGERITNDEMMIIPHGEEAKIMLVSGQPILDREGQKIGAVVAMHDITDRKHFEQALQKSEERMRLFFERQLVGMAITSPQKGWLQVNDKLCRILGYSREELAHLTWAEMTFPEDLAPDVAQFDRLLSGEIDDYMLEKRFQRKDGSIMFTNLSVGCVRNADRSVDFVLAFLEDITERKRAEEAIQTLYATLEERVLERTAQLKEAIAALNAEIAERGRMENILRRREQEFRTLVENSADTIARYGRDLRLLYANPAFAALVEDGTEELNGTTPSEYPGGPNAVIYKQKLREVFANGKSSEFELQWKSGNNREIWSHINMTPEFDQDSEVESILAVGRDISELRRSSHLLMEKRQRLADLALELSMAEERERRRIAANLHDIVGQDLALARIKLGLLSRKQRANEERELLDGAHKLMNGVIKSVRSLTHLINPPILQSSGLEAALQWLGRQMVEEYGLMVEFRNDHREKPIRREVKAELYFAVRELLINVVKHAGTNSATVSVFRENDTYNIVVEDSGSGFVADNDVQNLADSGSFGLFNIRRRITYFGGEFEISSSPGNGTRVTIKMPLDKVGT